MTIMRGLVGSGLLITSLCSWADAFNGQVQGVVDDHSLDVAVVCEREKIGARNWFKVQSDPSMHGGLKDRNGDGVAIVVSSNGEQAVFEVLVADQEYKFVGTKDVAFSETGFVIESTMKRYEGTDRREVGQYAVRLAVDCPEG